MLSALLPGLRDLRTPLVTGYLYLLCVWVTFGEQRLRPDNPNVFMDRVIDLRDLLGVSFAFAAISFVAFLVGSLLGLPSSTPVEDALRTYKVRRAGWWGEPFVVRWDDLTDRLRKWLRMPFDRARAPSQDRLDSWLSEVAQDIERRGVTPEMVRHDPSLPMAFVQTLRAFYARTEAEHQDIENLDPEERSALERNERRAAFRRALAVHLQNREADALAVRMQIEQPLLFDSYDRLKSESELRLSIFVPLMWLVTAAAVLLTPWAVLLVSVPLLIGYQGLRLQAQAQERITQALASGAIESPVVSRLLNMRVRKLKGQGAQHEDDRH